MSARKELRDILREFNIQTSEAAKSKRKCGSFFWLVYLIVSVVCFSVSIVNDLKAYVKDPIAISISKSFHTEMELPRITICVRQPVEAKYYIGFPNMTMDDYGYFSSALTFYPPQLDRFLDTDFSWIEEQFNRVAQMTGLGKKDMEKFVLQTTGMRVESMFQACTQIGNPIPCDEIAEVYGYFETDFCFNISDKLVQDVPGFRGSLQLVLTTQILVRSGMNDKDPGGWKIWFSRDGHCSTLSSPVSIMEGAVADVKLSKIAQKRINTTTSPCVQDALPLYNCYHQCDAERSMQECGCIRVGTRPNKNFAYTHCWPGKEGFCSYRASRNVTCSCNHLACSTTDYHGEVTFLGLIPNNTERQTIVNLYYDSLTTTTFSENHVYSGSALIGTIGGQASLWLGVRLANIVQVVYYAFWAIKGGKGRKKVNVIQDTTVGKATKLSIKY